MPKHMLVALDLEAQSQAVLSRAIEIAAVTSSGLTVLHVVEAGRNDASLIADSFDRNSAYDYLLSKARSAVERLVSECAVSRVHFEIVLDVGQASTVIPNLAERLQAGLIIIGISNRWSLRERVIGSTADRVIRTSRVSVLVIKHSAKASYRRVVAAIDFSPQAESVVSAPSVLLPHARLKLVHVTDIPLQFQQALIQTGTSEEEITQYRRARLRRSREQLARLADQLLKHGNYEIEVLEGEPATKLVRLSRSRGVDVIALGAHGRGVILQFFLGSVAQKLLREGACDLLISRSAGVLRDEKLRGE